MKTCKSCNAEKPLDQFWSNSRRKDGKETRCGDCMAQKWREWNEKNLEKRRSYDAARYQANKDAIKEKVKKWVVENPERAAARKKEHKDKNIELYRGYARRWAEKNIEKKRKSAIAWNSRNPESRRASKQNRRARERSAKGRITKQDVTSLMHLQKEKCANCHKPLAEGYHVDHVMPLARGGSNERHNLQLLCPFCNLSKNALDPLDWAAKNGRLL